MKVDIIPFEPGHYCSKNLKFEWEITSYLKDELKLKLLFEEPDCVSASSNIGDTI